MALCTALCSGKAAVASAMSGQPPDSSSRPLSTRFLGIRSKLNPVVLQQEKKAAAMPEEEDYDAKLAAAIKAAKRNGSARRQSK